MGELAHPQRRPTLTARERELLTLLAQELSNRAIAQRLRRSEPTVESHVASLLGKLGKLGKLGVASRADATALARRHSS